MSISKIKVVCGFGFFLLLLKFLMYLVFKIIPLQSQELLPITLYLLSYKYIFYLFKSMLKRSFK